MDPKAQTYVPISVKGAALSILVVLLLVAGKDSLLALLAGLAPLVFAGGESSTDAAALTGPATGDELDPLLERLHEVQVRAWRPLSTLAHFIDVDHPDRGVWAGAEVPMPLVESWPRDWPLTQSIPADPTIGSSAGLSAGNVAELVDGLRESHRRLVILGAEDTGKTSVMLALFLQAQHARDAARTAGERRRFAVPLRVSLAGWPEDDEESAATSLLSWTVSRLEQDYPGLLAHGDSLELAMRRIWDSDELHGNQLMLFIDGIDTVAPGRRNALLEKILDETRGRSITFAARTETWPDLLGRERDTWAELTLATPTDVDVALFLTGRGQPNGVELVRWLIDGGESTEGLRRNPRLLHLLDEAYRERLPDWLPVRPGVPARSATEVMDSLWSDLLEHVEWPNQVPTPYVRGTLQWIARERLFSNTRFAWWQVPQAARTDPTLASAYRWLQWRRAGSALAWALTTFAAGVLILTWLLLAGVVQGYDRASRGLQSAVGLSWQDVQKWKWKTPNASGLTDLLVTNPVYLGMGIVLLVCLIIVLLARFGGEFEHGDDGQPQILRLGLPRWRDLRSLPQGVHGRAVLLVLSVLGVALVLQLAGSSLAGQLWAGSVFAALFVLVLAWLHWCTAATDDFTPAGMFASDRMSSQAVALSLGVVTALVSGALSWWFTAAGHVPTLGQCLWIVASTSTSVGLARGFSLGAGMGAPLLLRLRPGFGIGYASRLRLLERALRRHPIAGSPMAVIEILDLERTHQAVGRPVRQPGALDVGVLLRPVGPLIRLRESDLEDYLVRSGPVPRPGRGPLLDEPSAATTSLSGVLALSSAAAVALLICTGSAAVVLPRLPCARWSGLGGPNLVSDRPVSTVWLENGQCVGFAVLFDDSIASKTQARDVFTSSGSRGSGTDDAPERDRAAILQQIARANAAIPDPDRTANLLFLAPLTRTSGSSAINALWQLDGARAAQAAINADGKVYVRLIVANAGENFTSGTSVVQAINRAFPQQRGDNWSIKSVIGVAQSRTSAREALAQFPKVQIVGASLYGTDMRHGLVTGQQPDLGSRFVSVAPSDLQAAKAMLAPNLIERAGSLLPDPDAAARGRNPSAQPRNPLSGAELRIIRDPDDTYFSNDLSNWLLDHSVRDRVEAEFLDEKGITAPPAPVDLREVDSADRLREIAATLCDPKNSRVIWLFAGRGNQLSALDNQMTQAGLDGCAPVVIAGPGGISMVSGSDARGAELHHMRNLFFYSLAETPATTGQAVGSAARSAARASDRATGYASVIEGLRRVLPTGSRACPFHPDPTVAAIGVNIPTGAGGDGHNTLGPGNQCGAPNGSETYFCRFQPDPAETCLAATPVDDARPTAETEAADPTTAETAKASTS